jgi:hypothetical protein
MKKTILLVCIIAGLAFTTNLKAQYIDLSTGKTITVIRHSGNGMMFNTQTSRPVYLYINPTTRDTFYGRTGEIVNGKIMRNQIGNYVYDADTYVYKNGDYQLRTAANNYDRKVFKRDGDVVYKSENAKMKKEIDGDLKEKNGEAKTKIETDGVIKNKDGDYKLKVDADGNLLEKDSTFKVKVNTDGSIKLKDKDADYKGKVGTDGDMKEKTPAEKRKMKRDKAKTKKNESGNE